MNRGAFLIAQSVTKGGYHQSYVAAGPPLWVRNCLRLMKVSPLFKLAGSEACWRGCLTIFWFGVL